MRLNSKDLSSKQIKWSWSTRNIWRRGFQLLHPGDDIPQVGDLALFRVEKIGYHDTIVSSDNGKIRIYPGDMITGVFGNRYATDAYEGLTTGITDISLLTGGGMVGTLVSKHETISKPTTLSFVGFIGYSAGLRVNLKEMKLRKSLPLAKFKNIVVVVGTGMNTGKTTVSRLIIRALFESGLRVGACKLTGSVSNRDQDEMRSACACVTMDFSDYGFPSTYMCSKGELFELFNTMLSDIGSHDPDVVILEIADGILQRETKMILEDAYFRNAIKGIVLSAESSLSGLYATQYLEQLGYHVFCVSGRMTSSPLYVREFQSYSAVQVVSSATGDDNTFANILRALMGHASPLQVSGYEVTQEIPSISSDN